MADLEFATLETIKGHRSSVSLGGRLNGDGRVTIIGVIPHSAEYDLRTPVNRAALLKLCRVAGIEVRGIDECE